MTPPFGRYKPRNSGTMVAAGPGPSRRELYRIVPRSVLAVIRAWKYGRPYATRAPITAGQLAASRLKK